MPDVSTAAPQRSVTTAASRPSVCYKPTMPRSIAIAAAGVFALCLLVYGVTLYPTVPGGDAGELIVVADALGVAHPPGYPLWTLLAHGFAQIAAGSVAWRVAWLSTVCSAAASALIFACVASFLGATRQSNSEHRLPDADRAAAATAGGIVGATLFAFSPTVWAYAVGAEVFPLHGFFVALLFFLSLRWDQAREPRIAYAIALTIGLGLTNHLTLVFYALPVALWMLWTGRRVLLTRARLAAIVAFGLLGLTPYAYLWIAGTSQNPMSWGDTATWSGLVDHLLRRDYGTFQLLPVGHAASSSYFAKQSAYAAHFLRASLGVGAVLAGIAVVAVVTAIGSSNRVRAAGSDPSQAGASSWPLLPFGCVLLYLGAFHALANVALDDALLLGVLSRFWMQADVALAILAGIGAGLCFTRLPARRSAVAWGVAALCVVVSISASGREREARGERVVEDYGRAILEPLPHGALLLTHGDLITNVVRYLQSCEGVRNDVVVLDQELMTKPWYIRRMAQHVPALHFPGAFYHPAQPGGFSMRAFLDANREGRNIFVYPEWKAGDPTVVEAWRAWPEGLALRAVPLATKTNTSKWTLDSAAALAAVDARGWPALDRYPAGTWERVALEDIWQARHRRALFLLSEAIATNNDPGLLTIARGEFEAAARMHPDPPWYLFKNLGMVYDRLAAASPWLRREQLAVWKRYLANAPAYDADRAAIAAAVKQLEAARESIPATPAN